jgi:hypothetical protein
MSQGIKLGDSELAIELGMEFEILSHTCVKSGFLIGLEQVSLSSSLPAFCPRRLLFAELTRETAYVAITITNRADKIYPVNLNFT